MKKAVKWLLAIILVLALLAGGGYYYLYQHGLSGRMLVPAPASADQIKVACIGDSITYGHGISAWPKNNYPVQLQGILGEDYHVRSFGVSGRAVQDTSDQPYTALDAYTQSIEYGADIIVFMMGTNDSKPENWLGGDAFRAALCTLLDSYLSGTDQPQIVLCTPAAAFFTEKYAGGSVTSHDIQPAVVTQIAEIVRSVAAERDYPLVDVYELALDHPEWFASDGVHPGNDGAAAIAQAVAAAVAAL